MNDERSGDRENSKLLLLTTVLVAGPLGGFGMMAFLAGALEIFGPEPRAFWTALLGAFIGILVYGFMATVVARSFGMADEDRNRLFWAGSAICFSLATWLGATLLHLDLLVRVSTAGALVSFCLFALLLGWLIIQETREGSPGGIR